MSSSFLWSAVYYAIYAIHCAGTLWFYLLSLWMKSYAVTFPLLRYCYYAVNVVLTPTSVDEILQCGHSNESHSCVLFIMLVRVVLCFTSADEILKSDHSLK